MIPPSLTSPKTSDDRRSSVPLKIPIFPQTQQSTNILFFVDGSKAIYDIYREVSPAVSIYRIVDSKVVEMRSFIDMDFFKELGVIEYKGFPDEVT